MSSKYKFKNPDGLYFITYTVVNWADVFTRNIYRDLMIESFVYCQKEKGLAIHAYVIMTNHIHMIISQKGTNELSGIMRDLKKFTSFKLIGALMENDQESRKDWLLKMFEEKGLQNSHNTKYQFWQEGNHPVELISSEMIEQRLDYIHQNPVKAGFVHKAEDFVYSSAMNYCGEKGLFDIDLID